MTRYVVLEDVAEPVAAVAAAVAVAEISPPGAVLVRDWAPRPHAGADVVRAARIATPDEAALAVLAAVNGERLVLIAAAEREVIDRLCDDLRRLGTLDHRVGTPAGPQLAPDERALLAHLVGGATLGAAAKALHISRRTADRRLAAARAALGARSTAEAVALAAQLGVSPPAR